MIYIVILVSAVLLIPVFLFLFLHVIPILRGSKLVTEGIRVEGECTLAAWSNDTGALRVTYKTLDGVDLVHRNDLLHAPNARRGDSMDILYDPRKPSRSMVAETAEGLATRRLLSGIYIYVELFFLLPQMYWVYLLASGTIHISPK